MLRPGQGTVSANLGGEGSLREKQKRQDLHSKAVRLKPLRGPQLPSLPWAEVSPFLSWVGQFCCGQSEPGWQKPNLSLPLPLFSVHIVACLNPV